ncbi:MAG: FAD-dependent oxidoreductase [Chloroflexota bacterium]
MDEDKRYDLVIIGSGPAGDSAAQLAATAGYRVAIVERLRAPGGVVVANGGVPVKTLRETVMYLTGFMDRETYGLSMDLQASVVSDVLASRTQDVCQTIATLVRQNLTDRGIDLIHGSARLGASRTVIVEPADPEQPTRVLHPNAILIASGSRPFRPPVIDFDDPDVWDNEKLLNAGRIPSSLVIIGGGAIGCEYGSIYRALGADVTIVDVAERLLPNLDGELSRRATETYERAGIHLVCGAKVQSVGRVDGVLTVQLASGATFQPDAVLVAAGRVVNTEGLGLEDAGVALDERGRITVNDRFQTTAPGIFAAGDVIGPTLASVSMEQGRVAVSQALDIPFKTSVATLPIIGVYSMPEIAMAGLTEEAAQAQGIDYEVGRCDFSRIPRAHIAGRTDGLLKLVFERSTRKLLGVHILCDIASELVPLGQEIISQGGTLDRFVDLTLAVPTYTLAYKLAAFDGLARLAEKNAGVFV